MREQTIQVDVIFDDVRIIKESYALYGVLVKIIRRGNSGELGQPYEQHVYRRFSEFWDLKNKLEKEFNAELPYELPARQLGLWPRSTLDPDVIEHRKIKLSKFLKDLLNDSFDTKWKHSIHVSNFLKLSADWNASKAATYREADVTAKESESPNLSDPEQWLIGFRDCKTLLEQCKKESNSKRTQNSMQLRLALYNLENALKENYRSHEIGETELDRRNNLLVTLKRDINEMALESTTNYSIEKNANDHEDRLRSALFTDFSKPKSPKKPLAGRRKFGETDETTPLNNQELLQLHKSKMQEQDQELEQIRKIVQGQKNLSLEMNQELAQQNDLLDLLDNDVDNTASKLRNANRKAKQFNND